ncbi:MAG: efflux RND transporter periplasmic adaptor subunit [Planctomycetes bacterium]|nr:efflux RND transporter periplasmic adaptor subunit [Planctomycetota bacterium]
MPPFRSPKRSSSGIAIALALLLAGCQQPAAPEPVAPPAPAGGDAVVRLSTEALARHPLTLATAVPRDLRRHCRAPARLAFDGDHTALVPSNLRGRIVELPGRLGARVAAGDPLVVLECSELGDLQAELLQQRQLAAGMAPQVALAEQAWQRGRTLQQQAEGVSRAEVERREADYRRLLAEQQRAEQAATAARQRLTLFGMSEAAIDAVLATGRLDVRHVLRAPQDGLIAERSAVLGARTGPDEPPLFVLVEPRVLWALAEVPEAFASRVQSGTAAEVHLTYRPELTAVGTVTLVAPRLDPSTRTAQVRIELRDPPAALRAGMSCEVRLELAPSAGEATARALAVPESAVQQLDGRSVVFVPVPGDATAFAPRDVEVEPAIDGFVPIRAGLRDGDPVVTEGSFLLKAIAAVSGGEEK